MADDIDGYDPKVVSLAERRERTLRIDYDRSARECDHRHVTVNPKRRIVTCDDCRSPVDPMSYVIGLASRGERAFYRNEAAEEMAERVQRILDWSGEIVLRRDEVIARVIGRNGARLEARKTGGLGIFERITAACVDAAVQWERWGSGDVAYPRYTITRRGRRSSLAFEVGVQVERGCWSLVGDAPSMSAAISTAREHASASGAELIIEDRPRRLWGR